MSFNQAVVCAVAIFLGGACDVPSGNEIATKDVVVAAVGGLTIENPYAPEPVTPDVGSLYFTLRNHGDLPDRVTSVVVNLASDVSLHDQNRAGNSVRMVAVESIDIPSRGSVALKPGGLHAMLRELSRHYRRGDSLSVTVQFANAGVVTFWAPVVSYVDVVDRMQRGHREAQH